MEPTVVGVNSTGNGLDLKWMCSTDIYCLVGMHKMGMNYELNITFISGCINVLN